jgi:hypothetical protein
VPLIDAPSSPDRWVRVHGTGSWWTSNIPPLPPHEREGGIAFRCPSCDMTLRTVEGGPLGFDRVARALR